MAAGTTLILEFGDANDNSIFFSYSYANSETLASDVKTLMNTIIANGSIFQNVPVSIKSAKAVVTSETHFDLTY